VTNTGHCHPKVVKAIQDQATQLIHAQFNIYMHKPMLQLIEELLPVVPPGLDSFYFTNSGAECLEGAVKLAKHATGRTNIIVFQGSFHGRTHLTMSMTTSKTGYKVGLQPLVSGIFVAPYPYAYYYGMDEEQVTKFALKELKTILKGQTAPDETAAIIIEPVLGEGGYVVPPKAYMQELRQICTDYGILLIADEVQSGFGRTGKFFAVEHFGIVPDIMTVAKGIASGMPLSGVITRKDIGAKWRTGSHGGTFGGNIVACAAAVATVQVIKEEGLLENATERGQQLMSCLRDLQKQYPVIGDVRGLGLMIGMEFTKDGQPDSTTPKAVIKAAQDEGLLLLNCGTYDNVIRWIPPLNVTEEQINEGVDKFTKAMKKAA
jgi:4-aminobutyrate aminotransferase